MQLSQQDIDRFHKRVERRGPDECWPWTGSFTDRSYGRFWCDGKTRRAHKVAFIIAKGQVTDDAVVRHECDNPPCCNPSHLLSGTQQDNIDDRGSRNRTSRQPGTNNPAAVLNDDKVMEIRRLVSSGKRQKDVGDQFGVAQGHVSEIVRGKIWSHLPILPHRSRPGPLKGTPRPDRHRA